VVAGRTFPVIEQARRRQGLARSPAAQPAPGEAVPAAGSVHEATEPATQERSPPSAPAAQRALVAAARALARSVGERFGAAPSHDERGRSVLITGASSGIGRAAAALFAAEGYRVFGTSRSNRPDPPGIEMLALDVRSDESVARCAAQLQARAGAIDVLVNTAGVAHRGIAEETSLDDARAVFETNFFGVVRMTNAVLPTMRQRRRGRIINVGSGSASAGEPGEAFYSASKHALVAYSDALRHEVSPFGIHVSVVEPGAFQSQTFEAERSSEAAIADYDDVRRAGRSTWVSSQGGGCDPGEVARTIVDVARAASPRLRYRVGADAVWIPYLKLLLPPRWFDAAMRRTIGRREQRTA
jgi:NAD(P)-dependent dehydrogenase (short-subunit alcohol dehydrogenase family)